MTTTETIEHRGQQFEVLFDFYEDDIGKELEIISASVVGKEVELTLEDTEQIEHKLWNKHKEYVRKTLAGD